MLLEPETFGKQVGGDIIENKKTYLYLKAVAFSNQEEGRIKVYRDPTRRQHR
jgi:geranylgeranyl pyrophosphate synthase